MAKPSIEPVVWHPPKAPARARRPQSDRPLRLEIVELPGSGPEDVVLDPSGHVLTGLSDGRILRISPDGRHLQTVADTGGRPLGLECTPDGELLVADAQRGLLAVHLATGRVTTLVDRVDGRPIVFCSNVVRATDGTVYFSESSTRLPLEHYKGELLAHSGTGRVSRRTPDGRVELVADGFQFANGLALAADGASIVVAETGGYCLTRVGLSGDSAGRREPLVENLPAFPDNLGVGSDGLIWVALPSPRDAVLDLLSPRPPALRKLVWALPEALQPKEKKTVWVQAYDTSGVLVHDLQTTHPQFAMATGVAERDGTVWIGSLSARAVARARLNRHGD